MTEEKMVETIYEHDQAIKSVAKAIDTLTEEAKTSNVKLDSIVTSMGKQELILEKITNIETRTKDSFNRVHSKIEDVKNVQNVGCTPLQLNAQANKTIASRIEKVEKNITWIVRTLLGAFVSGLVGSLFMLARG
jgi:uncharacterized protein YutD